MAIIDMKALLPFWETDRERTSAIVLLRKDPLTDLHSVIRISKLTGAYSVLTKEQTLYCFPDLEEEELDEDLMPLEQERTLTREEIQQLSPEIKSYLFHKYPSLRDRYPPWFVARY